VFDSILNKFHIRFKDRTWAANLLAQALKDIIKNVRKDEDENNRPVVLGIPRGGVIIADVISKKLDANLNIVIPRKLTAPHNEELAIGAVMEDGTTYLNESVIQTLEISNEYIEKEIARQIEEIRRRTALYRKPGLDYKIISESSVVILADDGAATGATPIAAARWIRKNYIPKCLILAVPIATKDTVQLLEKEADIVEVITSPPLSQFKSVGQYYQDFNPVTDEQVMDIMHKRGLLA